MSSPDNFMFEPSGFHYCGTGFRPRSAAWIAAIKPAAPAPQMIAS